MQRLKCGQGCRFDGYETNVKTILHIDDDEDIREITRFALTDIGGISVVQCSSGSEGLDRLESTNPDLILLDVVMPDMSGEEAFQRIQSRQQRAAAPVVFMTAKGDPAATERLLGLGAADVIVKPFDPLTLADDLRSIWQQID